MNATSRPPGEFSPAGDILHWDGFCWEQIRKGGAGESVALLKAVPATYTTPALVWAQLFKKANGRTTETLLLCSKAGCSEKVGRHSRVLVLPLMPPA